jgi:hypothetical protein
LGADCENLFLFVDEFVDRMADDKLSYCEIMAFSSDAADSLSARLTDVPFSPSDFLGN